MTVHGIRHSFHDLARQQGVPDAVVKAMAGRSGVEVSRRGQDKHLHYSPGVTVEEMRQASMALMRLVPTGDVAPREGRDRGRDRRSRDRDSTALEFPLVDPAPAAPTARRRVLACLPALTRSGLCVTAG